jgi:hypothetical protein
MLYTTQALSENEAHIITNTDTLHIPIKVVNSCFGNGAERISRNPQLSEQLFREWSGADFPKPTTTFDGCPNTQYILCYNFSRYGNPVPRTF